MLKPFTPDGMAEVSPGLLIPADVVAKSEKAAEAQRVAKLRADAALVNDAPPPAPAPTMADRVLVAVGLAEPPAPPAHPTPPALDDHEHVRRVSALARHTITAEGERDAKLRELQRQIGATQQACRDSVAEATRRAAETHAARRASIAEAIRTELYPIASTLEVDPFKCARALAATWNALAARAERELGEPLTEKQLVFAFASAAGRDDEMHDDQFYSAYGPSSPAALAVQLAKALAAGNVFDAESSAKQLAAAVHAVRSTVASDPGRCAAMRSSVTPNDVMGAIR